MADISVDPGGGEADWLEAELSDSDREEVEDERKHAQLLAAVTTLNKKKRFFAPERTELAGRVNEFHVTRADEKVKLHELVGALKKQDNLGDLKKQLNRVQKPKHVLDIPLHKLEKERISRTLAYDATREDVSKWGDIIKKNRMADQLEFPLEKSSVRIATTDEFVKRFRARTPLEQEVAALLNGNKEHDLSKDSMLTASEEKALMAMDLEEAQARRAELQKYRVLLSYRESKIKRQKKIKSKSYHRILRKEKVKKGEKAMNELQKKDPEAFAEKVLHIDRVRVQERMSLKHRGGSKFMLQKKMFSKYNDNAREAVQEMIKKSQELTKKVKLDEDSGDSDEEVELADSGSRLSVSASSKNPWMSGGHKAEKKPSHSSSQPIVDKKTCNELKKDKDEEENPRGFLKKFEQVKDVSKKASNAKVKGHKEEVNSGEEDMAGSDADDAMKDAENFFEEVTKGDEGTGMIQSLNRRKTLEDFEGDLSDHEEQAEEDKTSKRKKSRQKLKKTKELKAKSDEEGTGDVEVDPKKFLTLESKLVMSSELPELIGKGDDEEDEEMNAEERQRMTIAQAFASDDVVDEFISEKMSKVDQDKPKDIDLTLPGWGEWGGEGISTSRKKERRFIIKAPDATPRMDRKLGNVIISEKKDNSIAKHQVRNIPFPFSNPSQFESSIRAPVGKDWNTELSYRELIKPKVRTKIGQIIEPIDKESTFKKVQKRSKTGKDFLEMDQPEPKKKKKLKKK